MKTGAGRGKWAAAAVMLAATGLARGADAPPEPDAASQAVEVHGLKDPAFMPYRQAYDMIAGIDEATGHRVGLHIRVLSARTHEPLPELRLRIEGEHTQAQVPVSASGDVDVPLDRLAYDDKADIVANQPKKALSVTITIVPVFAAGDIRYADVVEAVRAGDAAFKRIVPWYFRLLMPTLHGVDLCYREAGRSVTVAGTGAGTRAADQAAKDGEERPVSCARFGTKDATLAADSVLRPGEGWQALFW